MSQVEENIFPDIPGYSILSCLATGGMGTVFVALDLRLERRVAIKVIKKPHVDAFRLQEASIQAQVNHKNVIQIFNVVEFNHFIAVVMEYVEGCTLQLAYSVKRLNETQRVTCLLEIAQGMEAIHRENIVHSDLSMNNIVVTDENQIKLLDFGIAQKLSSERSLVAKHANSHYASPEQLNQSPIDFRSDLFSFGVIAFQLITHQHPFGEADSREERIKRGQFIKPRDICPEISPVLHSLLVQLLSIEPKDRPFSFEEVAIRLKQHLAQASLEQDTAPIKPSCKPNRPITNKTKHAALFSLSFVLLIIALVYLGLTTKNLKSVKYVLVDRISIQGGELLDNEEQMQVEASIEHAIYQYVIDHPNLRLVPRKEIGEVKSSIQQLAESTGITDIISSELTCQPKRCMVSLFHHAARKAESASPNWVVVAQQTWPTQTQERLTITLNTTNHLMKLFPLLPQYKNVVPLAGQDYDEYLTIFNDVKLQGKRQPETWWSLLKLIRRNPQALSAYWLLRELSIDLYYVTNDTKYLTDFLNILDRAPTAYRESEIGLTDRFKVTLAAGELATSEDALNALITLGIDASFKSELHARLLFAKQEYQKAAVQYQLAANARQSISLLHNLGLTLYYAGDVSEAKKALQKALDINPEYYPSNQLLASLFLLTENLDKAIVAYQQLLKHQRNSQDLSDLSIAYMLKGDFKQGIHYAETAVELAPKNPVQILNLADLLYFSGDKVAAKKLYKEILAIEVEQNDTDALLLKTQALVHLGQHQAALRAINLAEKSAANNIEVLYTAALIYTQVGELVSAAVHVQDALSQGLGPLWFNTPWFTPLCATPWFAEEMDALNMATICTS